MSQLEGDTWLNVVWMGYCHAQCTRLCTTFELLHSFVFNGGHGLRVKWPSLLYRYFLGPFL